MTMSGNDSRKPVARAHQRAARAEPGDEHVDPVERLCDLGPGALVVGARVGRVRVLEGHEVLRIALRQLEREPDGAVRALGARRQHDLGAVEPQHPLALLRRVLGHHAGERVALQLRDHRERVPGVAGGRLEQMPARSQLARRFGRLDHRLRHAVLDRAGRVLALELRVDLAPSAWARSSSARRAACCRRGRAARRRPAATAAASSRRPSRAAGSPSDPERRRCRARRACGRPRRRGRR